MPTRIEMCLGTCARNFWRSGHKFDVVVEHLFNLQLFVFCESAAIIHTELKNSALVREVTVSESLVFLDRLGHRSWAIKI